MREGLSSRLKVLITNIFDDPSIRATDTIHWSVPRRSNDARDRRMSGSIVFNPLCWMRCFEGSGIGPGHLTDQVEGS